MAGTSIIVSTKERKDTVAVTVDFHFGHWPTKFLKI